MKIPIYACSECAALMIPSSKRYRRNPRLRERFRVHRARGLCETCYDLLRKQDVLLDHERLSHSADDMLDDWALLRDDGYGVRLAAERMDVTFAALDKALCRAKRRGDPRGSRVPFAHDMGRSA